MRDIGKRAAVDEGRDMLKRLHKVRLQCILHKSRHRAFRMDVARRDRGIVIGIADDDLGEALLHVADRMSQTEDRHDLRCDGDIETAFSRYAIRMTAEADDDVTEHAVIHIHDTVPNDAARIDAEYISLLDVVIHHSSEKVVCSSDRMEIAREMKIDIFHRDDLRIAAAGSTALDAHAWTEGWFTETDHRLLAELRQSLPKADCGRSLAFTGRCRRDRRHKDQLAIRFFFQLSGEFQRDLCFVMAVVFQFLCRDADAFTDFSDRLHFSFLCNFDIA